MAKTKHIAVNAPLHPLQLFLSQCFEDGMLDEGTRDGRIYGIFVRTAGYENKLPNIFMRLVRRFRLTGEQQVNFTAWVAEYAARERQVLNVVISYLPMFSQG